MQPADMHYQLQLPACHIGPLFGSCLTILGACLACEQHALYNQFFVSPVDETAVWLVLLLIPSFSSFNFWSG